jgi:hypothetical protein
MFAVWCTVGEGIFVFARMPRLSLVPTKSRFSCCLRLLPSSKTNLGMRGATPTLLSKFSSYGGLGIGIKVALIYLFLFTLNGEMSGQ